jgi:predicted dehydrogenase
VSAPSVGIVGARRVRQGLGPFVARDLVKLGAKVEAFVTTSADSRDAALEELAGSCGISARGYLTLDEMLANERLDALVILSPSNSHRAYLDAALAAGLPVLCEKPLVWGDEDIAGEARRIVTAFASKGLLLWENCQWPYTLPAYEQLFPGSLDRPPNRFWMSMQPASAGLQALADSLPHPLSLLQTLIPGDDARLEDTRFTSEIQEAGIMNLDFRYCTLDWSTQVRVRLVPSAVSPRAAAYALDDQRADRRVRGDDYRLFLVDEGRREVALDDPLTQLLAGFVAALTGSGPREQRPGITKRMELLGQLVHSYRDWEQSQSEEAGR